MSEIVFTFCFDPDLLTGGDLIALESGDKSTRFKRQLLGKFMQVDGKYLDRAAADKAFDALTVPEIKKAYSDFWQAVGKLREDAVNPTTEAA